MTYQTATQNHTGLHYEKYWQRIAWLMVLFVVWLSLTPSPPQMPSFFGWDKAQHITAYAGLMYWFGVSFVRHWRWPVFLLGLGIGLEIIQGVGGLRTNDPYDMLANTIGVVTGLFVIDTPLGGWLRVVDRILVDRFPLDEKSV